MQDPDKLYEDFKNFFKRLKYDRKDHKLEYIAVAEPQGRGAWHMHVMLKSDQPVLYIDNKKMEKLWGHGFTETEKLKGEDVGKYFSAYFTSMEIDAKSTEKSVTYTDKHGKTKKFKKGERLKFYPKGMNFFRCSRGIDRPSAELATLDNVRHEYGKPKKTNAFEVKEELPSTVADTDPDIKILTRIQREEYRKKSEKACKDGENIVQ
jgi:hypothetical protein